MAGLLKTPSLHLTPTLLHAPSVPFKPFCVSFAGGRNVSVSLSRRASLRSVSSGYPLRLLNLVPFASGEAETTETEVESNEPEVQETDGAVDVENENASAEEGEAEEEEAAVITALLKSYKEALADNNEGKIAEIEASLKSIEDEKFLLADKVASLSNELSVERDRLIRISADFDNFRKRTERERLNLVSNAQGEVVENLLAVLDNFERAKSQIKVETEGEEKVTNSYQSIYKQFVEILGSLGVIHVETVGKQFDPMLHEAIMREDSAEYEEGIVLEEYRKGFLLGERLLRPSMVKVSAGPGPEFDIEERLAVQIYDPVLDSWELCSPLPADFRSGQDHQTLTSALFKRRFYVFDNYSCFISSFCLDSYTWSDVQTLKPPGLSFAYLNSCNGMLVLGGMCGFSFNLWSIEEGSMEFSEIAVMPEDLLFGLVDSDDEDDKFRSLKCAGSGNLVYVFNDDCHKKFPACVCEIGGGENGICSWRRVPCLPSPVNKFHKVVSFCSTVSITDVFHPEEARIGGSIRG